MSSPGCAAKKCLAMEHTDPELLHYPGAAEREKKQPEYLLPADRGRQWHSPTLWGQQQRQDGALWGMTEVLLSPAMGHGSETHWKVMTVRMREFVFLFSFSSAAYLSTHFSWPRARQSCRHGLCHICREERQGVTWRWLNLAAPV